MNTVNLGYNELNIPYREFVKTRYSIRQDDARLRIV